MAAPRVRARKLPSNILQSRLKSIEKPVWPLAIINAAWSSGALPVETAKAIAILDDIWDLVRSNRLNKSYVENTIAEHDLDAQQLTFIAQLLVANRSDNKIASLGLDLLSVAGSLGSESASMILVDMVLENKKNADFGTSRYSTAVSQVKSLSENGNLNALVLMGKFYEEANRPQEAFEMFQKAISLNLGDASYEDVRVPLAEAYRNCARLASQAGTETSTIVESFETAALDYEDAMSFLYLAHMRGEQHPDYVQLLSQAAISGNGEAAYLLGLWHSRRGDEAAHPRQELRKLYSTASYWFDIAKGESVLQARSVMHILRIKRTLGQPDTPVLEDLESILEDLRSHMSHDTTGKIAEIWPNHSLKLSATDLEDLINNKR